MKKTIKIYIPCKEQLIKMLQDSGTIGIELIFDNELKGGVQNETDKPL